MTNTQNPVTRDIAEDLADLIEAVSTEWEVDSIAEGMRISPKADYIANAILAKFTILHPADPDKAIEHVHSSSEWARNDRGSDYLTDEQVADITRELSVDRQNRADLIARLRRFAEHNQLARQAPAKLIREAADALAEQAALLEALEAIEPEVIDAWGSMQFTPKQTNEIGTILMNRDS